MPASNSEQAISNCVVCMNLFSIDEKRVPHKCIDPKCDQRFCAECVTRIQICNGENRSFRCMHCSLEYDAKCKPIEDKLFKEKLWEDAIAKYGIDQTHYLLESRSTLYHLKFDIQSRKLQLENLISRRKCLPDWEKEVKMIDDGVNMVNKLENIFQSCDNQPDGDIMQYKNGYKDAISTSSDINNVGSRYIRFCEQLLVDISNAEMRSIMPETDALMKNWIDDFNGNEEFQPKISVFIEAIERDVKNRCSSMGRVKVGLIGCTNVGKSSLVNYLCGVSASNVREAAPVQSKKCTYYQLHYDRQQPLIHPEYPNKEIYITVIDVPGFDNDKKDGNYLEEIKKADCDIYLLVSDQKFGPEQMHWIEYIEQELQRCCILVRSKVDRDYLSKFRELTGQCYSDSKQTKCANIYQAILKDLRHENRVESHDVYLTAADSMISTRDEFELWLDHKFDFERLLERLGRLAFTARKSRFLMRTAQMISHVINTCFRRGYVINVLGYKIAAGIASVLPLGELIPKYLSQDEIQKAFGIDKVLLDKLRELRLTIGDGQLQTSVFNKYIEYTKRKATSKLSMAPLGTTAGSALVIFGTLTDDIARSVIPAVASGATRTIVSASTIVFGVALSAVVCALSAIRCGKNIFQYLNQLCDDLILVLIAVIMSIIKHDP